MNVAAGAQNVPRARRRVGEGGGRDDQGESWKE